MLCFFAVFISQQLAHCCEIHNKQLYKVPFSGKKMAIPKYRHDTLSFYVRKNPYSLPEV